ncbi:recombinase family protein [Nitrosomonas communis]|uniref:recombinase family protein n=1 Tax=Nitrosomonas communis TaxID=44574 RepID=UPI0034E97578|nr:recombinase family protein [Nitrosomonas communis]
MRKTLKPGDTFVITSIDRAFRSTIDAIIFLDEITRDGITFHSLVQHINTRTPKTRANGGSQMQRKHKGVNIFVICGDDS